MRVAPYRMWKGDWIIITDTHILVAMIIVCFWIYKYSWSLFLFFFSLQIRISTTIIFQSIHIMKALFIIFIKSCIFFFFFFFFFFFLILIWKSSKFVSTNISINDFYLQSGFPIPNPLLDCRLHHHGYHDIMVNKYELRNHIYFL